MSETTPAAPTPTPAPSLADMVAMMPFATLLGIELTAAGPDEVTGSMPWRPELCTIAGALHGGALMAMADSVGARLRVPQHARRGDDVDDRVEDQLLPRRARGHAALDQPAAARRADDRRRADRPLRRPRQAGRPGDPDAVGRTPGGVGADTSGDGRRRARAGLP